MSEFKNYYEYINKEAKTFTIEYKNEIFADVKDGNTDVYELINDSKIHEWVDNDFIYVDLVDSAYIIDQSDNVESDWGLWEGQDPQDAIRSMAFYTYRNDLYYAVKDLMEEELDSKLAELQDQLANLQEELENADEDDDTNEIEDEIDELIDTTNNFEMAIESL
jgi:DNA-binding transcriptional MerR regulator